MSRDLVQAPTPVTVPTSYGRQQKRARPSPASRAYRPSVHCGQSTVERRVIRPSAVDTAGPSRGRGSRSRRQSRTSPAPDPAEGVPAAGDRWRQAAADNAARWRPVSDLTDTVWGLDGAWRDPSARWNVAGVAPENHGDRARRLGQPRPALGLRRPAGLGPRHRRPRRLGPRHRLGSRAGLARRAVVGRRPAVGTSAARRRRLVDGRLADRPAGAAAAGAGAPAAAGAGGPAAAGGTEPAAQARRPAPAAHRPVRARPGRARRRQRRVAVDGQVGDAVRGRRRPSGEDLRIHRGRRARRSAHHRQPARHAGPGPEHPDLRRRRDRAPPRPARHAHRGRPHPPGVDHRDHRAGRAEPDRLPPGQPVDVVGPVDPAAAGRLPADPAHAEERHDRHRRGQAHDHHDRGDGR